MISWRRLARSTKPGKQVDVLGETQPLGEAAVVTPASTAPAAEPRERRRSTSRKPTTPGEVHDPHTRGFGQAGAASRPKT